MPKDRSKGPVINIKHPIEEAFGCVVEPVVLLLVRRTQKAAAEHGCQRKRYKSRDKDRHADGHCESWSNLPRMPLMKSTGMKTAASEMVIEIMVNPIPARR